jgi:sugar lactone lactonase YvrE
MSKFFRLSKLGLALLLCLVVLLTLIFVGSSSVDPVSWDAPEAPSLEGVYAPNNILSKVRHLPLSPLHGPEDLALASDGSMYVSSQEGYILKSQSATHDIEAWADTGGKPMGVELSSDGVLYIADALKGIIVVNDDLTTRVIVDTVDDEPLSFVSNLALAPDGKIYFTEATTRFHPKEHGGVGEAGFFDILEHSASGRLLVYDLQTKMTKVLLTNLNFPHGVSVAEDGRFVLVCETGAYRIRKLWLTSDKFGKSDVIVDNLPGFPDNISRGREGRFWIGLVARRSTLLDAFSNWPFLRSRVARFPKILRPTLSDEGHVIAINQEGEVLVSLQDHTQTTRAISGAVETDSGLLLTSTTMSDLGILDKEHYRELLKQKRSLKDDKSARVSTATHPIR